MFYVSGEWEVSFNIDEGMVNLCPPGYIFTDME